MANEEQTQIPPILAQAHNRFDHATDRGQTLWPSQREAYCGGYMTLAHEAEGLAVMAELQPVQLDRLAEKSMKARMQTGWTIPGPGSTYDTGFGDGFKLACAILAGKEQWTPT